MWKDFVVDFAEVVDFAVSDTEFSNFFHEIDEGLFSFFSSAI